jgi:glycerol uptake facilitator-like aquaporin
MASPELPVSPGWSPVKLYGGYASSKTIDRRRRGVRSNVTARWQSFRRRQSGPIQSWENLGLGVSVVTASRIESKKEMNTSAPTVRKLAVGMLALHSVIELVLTFFLLFGITTIVRFVIAPSPISRLLPGIHLKLLIVGAAVALLLAGLIISRPGKVSGGHMNPAISLAMWRFGVFPAAGLAPYIAAQLLGSVLGVVAARVLLGPVVAQPPVLYAVIQPAPFWSTVPLFAAEAIGMGLIVFVVGYCLSIPHFAPLVPWVVGILIGGGIALLGTSTGGCLNPARQFGPAVISGHTEELWVFLIAPIVGADIAVRLRQVFQKHRQVLTHRLCGTHPDGRPLDEQSGKTRPIPNPVA